MTKEIVLTQGKVALVDDDDFDRINQWKWCFDSGYAARKENNKKVYMHRVIFNFDVDLEIDHINLNKIDNRKENLRVCTGSKNLINRNKIIPICTSKYKGVSWDKEKNKWKAYGHLNKKQIFLGRYINEIDAAKAYDDFTIKNYQSFSRPNIF